MKTLLRFIKSNRKSGNPQRSELLTPQEKIQEQAIKSLGKDLSIKLKTRFCGSFFVCAHRKQLIPYTKNKAMFGLSKKIYWNYNFRQSF